MTIEGDPKLVNFNYFFTRKLNFMKESHALALFPGGFGTMDEGFEALTLLQTGKAKPIPVVMVDAPGGGYWEGWLEFVREQLERPGMISPVDYDFFKVTHDVDAAVHEVMHFYKNYQSSRYVGQQMVVRLARRLTAAALDQVNADFGDILRVGRFVPPAGLRPDAAAHQRAQRCRSRARAGPGPAPGHRGGGGLDGVLNFGRVKLVR